MSPSRSTVPVVWMDEVQSGPALTPVVPSHVVFDSVATPSNERPQDVTLYDRSTEVVFIERALELTTRVEPHPATSVPADRVRLAT